LFNVGKSVYEVVDIQSGRVIARKAVFGATMTTLRPWLQKDPCPKKIVSDAAMVLEVLAPALDAG
jgi:hypothetical protein